MLAQPSGVASSGPGTKVRWGEPRDVEACAAILDAWIDENPWMPRLHDSASIHAFTRDVVFATRKVLVADEAGEAVGYLALDGSCISALYLSRAARNRGVGARLVAAAKELRPDGLFLWAFQPNTGALRFYAREGFVEATRTDGDNEEGVPDVRMEWIPTEGTA